LRVLLVERDDFASGTSSHSSKLIHGGLHYLARGELRLARECVCEREHLLRDRGGLVQPLSFSLAVFPDRGTPGPWQCRMLLGAYELLRRYDAHRDGGRPHRSPRSDERPAHPGVPLNPGTVARLDYLDARTDDARLVLEVLREGVAAGGTAVNYVSAVRPVSGPDGTVAGARLQDRETGATGTVRAKVVVNATGPWGDELRGALGRPRRLRLIRGSHLVFPRHRFPLRHAVASLRPGSGDPVYFFPWKGVTVVGSTSVEHADGLGREPAISPDETLLLLGDVGRVFPALSLGLADVQATFAGLRPV
jgi:glycerol-3-phosphate dehydrogenase